jgi:transketolase
MTLLATGMALEGHIVFTYSIANFSTLRCLEMIRNDAAYHDANVKVVSVGGGFSYGPLGISHHATEDISIMRALPGVTCFSPGNLDEVEAVTREAVAVNGTCFLRLDKDCGSGPASVDPYAFGLPRLLRAGEDVLFIGTGGILSEIIKASDELDALGITCSVYSVHTLKPLISKPLVDAVKRHRAVITVEENTVHGGLGSMILEELSLVSEWPRRFLRIGLEGVFSSVVGSQQYLRRQYQLDSAAIVRKALILLREM